MTDLTLFTSVAVDSDTDIRLVKKGNAVYMLNCIKDGVGDNGVITNIKGTSEGLITIPGGINKILAACDDPERNRVIFFMSGSNSLAIMYMEKETQNYGFILDVYTGLHNATKPLTKIVNPRVVDKYLLFTDTVNEPACIDMIKFYNTTNDVVTDDRYSSITNDLFTLIKPPINWIKSVESVISYASYANIDYNKLNGAWYQFATRAIYQDNSKSVLSTYKEAVPPTNETLDGVAVATSHNGIKIDIYKTWDERVKAIELYVRKSSSELMALYDTIDVTKGPTSFSFGVNTVAGNYYFDCTTSADALKFIKWHRLYPSGDGANSWRIYSVLKVDGARVYTDTPMYTTASGATWSAQTLLEYIFYNDMPTKGVDTEDVSRLFDFVPITSGHQEVVEDSRAVYADITEGYDNVPVNVKYDFVTTSITDQFSYTALPKTVTTDTDFLIDSSTEGVTYWLYYKNVFVLSPVGAVYVVKSGDTTATVAQRIANLLSARGVPASYQSSPDRVRMTGTPTYAYGFKFGPNINRKFLSIKSNHQFDIGIVYRDKYGRMGNTNTNFYSLDTSFTELNTYPYYSQTFGIDYTRKVRATIKHLPPSWAYHYQFAVRKSSSNYFQVVVDASDTKTYEGKTWIRVNKGLDVSRSVTGHQLSNYIFEKGDTVTLIGDGNIVDSGGYLFTQRRVKKGSFDILGFEYDPGDGSYKKDTGDTPGFVLDGDGNKIYDNSIGYLVVDSSFGSFSGITTRRSLLLEIRKNTVGSDDRYYEVGDVYDVTNPATDYRAHEGTTQDQSYADPINTPAISTINWGNCFVYTRNSLDMLVNVESPFVSDFFISSLQAYGRVNSLDANARQERKKTMLRWGGVFVDNTNINSINRFDYDDYKLLNEKHGGITAIALTGYVLKAMTQKKETSIYVNRNILTNADGSENVTSSSIVLNARDPYIEDRGTLYRNSLLVVNRDLYYIDTLNGEYVRSSPNGQIPISNNGKRIEFKALCDKVNLNALTSDVLSYYDNENRLIFVTFIINNGAEKYTLGYHEPSNSWMDFYSFTPQYAFGVGNYLYGTVGGQIYRHNDPDSDRCSFYDVKYNQVVDFVQNENSVVKKRYKTFSYLSNKKWSVSELEIQPDEQYIRGMWSELPSSAFKMKEGVYCAEYLRNMKTNSSTLSAIDLHNGDKLIGSELRHRMVNSEDGEVKLFRVKVDYDISNNY